MAEGSTALAAYPAGDDLPPPSASLEGYISPSGDYVPPQARPTQQQVAATQPRIDPIWPTSNPVGTEKFVDYRGWDQPAPPPALPPDPVSRAIAPAPHTQYGSVLPVATDTETGQWRWAMPSSVRDTLQGAYDLTQGPRTGTVTPQASATLAQLAVPDIFATGEGGVVRTFGSVGAKGADIKAYKQAVLMEQSGLTRDRIYADTGWFRGVDGIWRFEIPDMNASVTTPTSPRALDLTIKHPDLFSNYPQVGRTTVSPEQLPPGVGAAFDEAYTKGGMWTPRPTIIVPQSGTSAPYMLHEIQHNIQDIEGMARGGNQYSLLTEPSLRPALIKVMQEFENVLYQQYPSQYPFDWHSPVGRQLLEGFAMEYYNRLAGEAESRLVENRMGLTPSERRENPPWGNPYAYGYDVPENQQIVRFKTPPGQTP